LDLETAITQDEMNGTPNFAKQLLVLGLAIALSTLAASTAGADVVVPGRCHMGHCWETKIFRKQPLQQTASGTLYAIETGSRDWSMEQPRPSERQLPFQQRDLSYVFCSRLRPSYIFKADGKYYAHLLNPDGKSYYGYNQSDYPIYWATCHNLVGPDFFSERMVTKSIQLGYPGNLPEEQIELNHPTDILH
jgi:hypothetical protein